MGIYFGKYADTQNPAICIAGFSFDRSIGGLKGLQELDERCAFRGRHVPEYFLRILRLTPMPEDGFFQGLGTAVVEVGGGAPDLAEGGGVPFDAAFASDSGVHDRTVSVRPCL